MTFLPTVPLSFGLRCTPPLCREEAKMCQLLDALRHIKRLPAISSLKVLLHRRKPDYYYCSSTGDAAGLY